MGQLVQLIGAALILSAYVSASRQQIRFDSVQFLALNTLGATILAVVAAVNRDLGFLLLEGVWAWVSFRGLRRALRAQKESKPKKPPGRRPAARLARRMRGKGPLRGV
ncbi:MAG TPA: hypothetical protein VGL92_11575 [Acidimicrobiia bacterium]|jgi:hypothetical protein